MYFGHKHAEGHFVKQIWILFLYLEHIHIIERIFPISEYISLEYILCIFLKKPNFRWRC